MAQKTTDEQTSRQQLVVEVDPFIDVDLPVMTMREAAGLADKTQKAITFRRSDGAVICMEPLPPEPIKYSAPL